MNTKYTKLSNVLRFLDDIPFINQGGCGISALAIYRWMKSHKYNVKKTPFVILLREFDDWEVERNEEVIGKGLFNRLSIPHVTIEWRNSLYDSTGKDADERHNMPLRQPTQLTEEQLVKALNTDTWNCFFDRRHTFKIEKELGIDLSDVETNQ